MFTKQQAIADQLDAGAARFIVSIDQRGWSAVPDGLSPWLYTTDLIDRQPLVLDEAE